jgi:hypothetical protein
VGPSILGTLVHTLSAELICRTPAKSSDVYSKNLVGLRRVDNHRTTVFLHMVHDANQAKFYVRRCDGLRPYGDRSPDDRGCVKQIAVSPNIHFDIAVKLEACFQH